MYLDFKSWIIEEMGENISVEKREGSEITSDPAMQTAMYVAYRLAYDPVAIRDGGDKAWSHGEWTYPSGGGTRAPKWTFYGVFPNESDLNVIRQKLEQYNDDIQKTADDILETKEPNMGYVGGVTYRLRDDSVKLTGTFGAEDMRARMSKMFAFAHLVEDARKNNWEVFLGIDSHLRDMIEDAKKLMPKFFKRGLVPSKDLDLTPPPKDVAGLIYNIVSRNPNWKGSGEWKGFNKETGGMNFQLSGTGAVEKFVYGNAHMWKKHLQSALAKSGVTNNGAVQMAMKTFAMTGMNPPGFVVKMVNDALKKQVPDAPEITPEGVKWLLQRLV